MKRIFFLSSIVFVLLLLFLAIKGNAGKFTLEITGTKPQLAKVVSQVLQDSTGTYSIAIKDLKTGEEYYQDADKVFDAGSLYKLGTMIATLKLLERGELGEDEVVGGEVERINKVLGQTEEEAEIKSGTIDFTIREALFQMITISHNYAAVLLTEKVGPQKAQEEINNLALKNTIIDTENRPKTTARDLALFFEKIYKRENMSVYVSQSALELLLKQQLNDRIPKYLPKNAKVAHKTGEIDFQKHDGGIVFTPNGDYIIVVLSESDNPTAASERIANISKEVYGYFSNGIK